MEGKGVSNGSYMWQMLFQLIHFLQGHILCFSVFQQTSDIKHVIQISLDLHRQLITLCVLGFLWGNTGDFRIFYHVVTLQSLRIYSVWLNYLLAFQIKHLTCPFKHWIIWEYFEHWLNTSRKSSSPSLVNSYCRCTRKFMSSTEWTTILMNCIQATWDTNTFISCTIKTGTKIPKCFHAPTMKSMFPSSLRKYSISFSKRCFSLQTCRYFYLDNHRNTVTPEYSQIVQVLNNKVWWTTICSQINILLRTLWEKNILRFLFLKTAGYEIMGFREDEMDNSDQEKVRLLYRLYGKRVGSKGQRSNVRPHVSP